MYVRTINTYPSETPSKENLKLSNYPNLPTPYIKKKKKKKKRKSTTDMTTG
jgi:hypothetical protein